jgi:hypothetical protein
MSRQSRRAAFLATIPLAALAAACGGSRAPIYDLRPTEVPFHYVDESKGSQSIETPGGPQGGEFRTEAALALHLGAATADGRNFKIVYESFEAPVPGPAGPRAVDASALAGTEITGVVGPDGALSLGPLPEVSAGNFDAASLAGILPDLLAPVPPDGSADRASWPHRFTLPTGGGMSGDASYEGEARFAGDTTFNGIPVRRIVSEGRVTVAASGTPPGAPGEIDMAVEGDARTAYLWDPERGVLVASDSESEMEGSISTMGFDLPMTMAMERRIGLVP